MDYSNVLLKNSNYSLHGKIDKDFTGSTLEFEAMKHIEEVFLGVQENGCPYCSHWHKIDWHSVFKPQCCQFRDLDLKSSEQVFAVKILIIEKKTRIFLYDHRSSWTSSLILIVQMKYKYRNRPCFKIMLCQLVWTWLCYLVIVIVSLWHFYFWNSISLQDISV